MKYEYDTNGSFGYFLVTVLGTFLIPVTFFSLRKKEQKAEEGLRCGCDGCVSWRGKPAKTRKAPLLKGAGLAVGWLIMAAAVFSVLRREDTDTSYNPYEILGVKTFASEESIRKQFRQLSIKNHPDKVPEEQREEAQKRFMELQRAYKTLIDEDQRKNWEEYGNPDGRTTISIGIALPSILTQKNVSPIFVAVYLLFFFFCVPFSVQKIWRMLNQTGGVDRSEMSRIYSELKEGTTEKRMLGILSKAALFEKTVVVGEDMVAAYERLVLRVRRAYAEAFGEEYEKPKTFSEKWHQWTYILFLSHFLRVAPEDAKLVAMREVLLAEVHGLISGIAKIAMVQQWPRPLSACVNLSAWVVQAVWGRDGVFLQLPFISRANVKRLRDKKIPFSEICDMPCEEQRAHFDFLSEEQFGCVQRVLETIPRIDVALGADAPEAGLEPGKKMKLFVSLTVRRGVQKTHHPFFEEEKTPYLWVFVSVEGKMVETPRKFLCESGELEIPVSVPWIPDAAKFQVDVCSDTFVGCSCSGKQKTVKVVSPYTEKKGETDGAESD
ncbi:MAG: translocation protein sec63 [Amphiamblys sp. WSBS2006]|nr:MAG: translocation protein sec63 [Amphiamblys sp. WSBS2006]